MLGIAIGDALGELAAVHQDRASLNDWLNEEDTLRYTDDTAMSIGLAEAIIENQGVDETSIGKAFQRNYTKEPWRAYSASTPAVFAKAKRHEISYSVAASKLYEGEGSFGNGAAMRIAPLAAVFRNSEKLRELSETSAKVTHAHPIGIDGACVLSFAIAFLVELNVSKKFPLNNFFTGMVKFAKTKEMKSKIALILELLASNADPHEASQKLKLSQKADETVPFALYSFLRNTKSFEECLYCAIFNGGDQDTLGAMASGLSGAYLGSTAIPKDWISKIENQEYLMSLAKQLNKLDNIGT